MGNNVTPTPKQRAAAKNILVNLSLEKPKTIKEVLMDTGYSDTIATTPSQVTKSVGFIKALEEAGVTDEKLSQVMNEGLNATKSTGEADHAIRHRFLDTAIKAKGHMKPAEEQSSANTYNTFIQNNTINPNAPDVKELAQKTVEFMMQQTKEK